MFMNANVIIKEQNNCKKDHFYCNICNYPLCSDEDFASNDEYECCHECFLTFAEARKKQWKNGWRPKQKTVDSYINKRKNIYREKGDFNEF